MLRGGRVFLLWAILVPGHGRIAWGQNSVSGAIQGFVLDKDNRSPIPDAKIVITNQATGVSRAGLSQSDGSYTVSMLSSGTYTIKCTHPDYEPDTHRPVSVVLGKTTKLRVPPFLLKKKIRPVVSPSQPASWDRISDPEAAAARGPSQAAGEDGPAASGVPSPAPQAAEPPARQSSSQTGPPAQSGKPPQAEPTERESSSVQMVNLENAMRGGNFDGRQLSLLPLPGMRTFDALALLVAGVLDPPQAIGESSGPGIGAGIGTSGQFSVNGMRSRANNFTIDGSDNNDPDVGVRRQGFLTLLPQSIESIEEFQISTLVWDSDLGRNLGSQVNAVSRTGSNRLHGQAYGYFTDSRLDARNFFDYTRHRSGVKNPFTRMQSGLTLAGPVVADRTHFFASFEGQKINALSEQHFASPTAAERTFLGLPSFKVVTSPNSYNSGFDYVALLGATPLGLNLLERPQHPLYPAPNDPGGPYGANTVTRVLAASGQGNVFSFKVTHQLGNNHALAARYNFTDDSRELPSVKKALFSSIDAGTRNHNLSLVMDSSISATLANQARFSFGRTRLAFVEHPENPLSLAQDLNITSEIRALFKGTDDPYPGTLPKVYSSTGPLGELVIRPFSPVGIDSFLFPQGRVSNTFQYADSVSKTWQKHTLRFGADIRRIQLNSRQDRNYRPLLEVNNGILDTRNLDDPGRGGRAFLRGLGFATLGQVSEILQTISAGPPNSNIGLRFNEFNLFFDENYRLRPDLTVDFGLRYEYNTVPHEVNDRIENALGLKGLPAATPTTLCAPNCALYIQSFNDAVDSYRRIVAGRERIYLPDRNNFGPHFGLAWDPWKDGRTAFRAGFALYYDAILGAVVSQSRNVFPSEIPFFSDSTFAGYDGLFANTPGLYGLNSVDYIRRGSNQLGGGSQDFAALLGALFYETRETGGVSFTLPEKDLRTPYVQQWHLTAEREIFGDYLIAASYVGTRGTRLTRLTTPNGGRSVTPFQVLTIKQGTTPTVSFGDGADRFANQFRVSRPNPFLGPYQIFENSAGSSFHSLQLEARKRYSYGLSFTGSYAWSHAIDDVSDIIETAGAPSIAQDSQNLGGERASGSFDVRHNFVVSVIADLPLRRARARGAARWLDNWQLASIFRARTGQPFTIQVPLDANLDGNLTDRPSTTQGLVFFDGHRAQRLEVAADRKVSDYYVLGRDGLVGRNTARGDGLVNWDLALNKKLRFRDFRSVEFRAEVFNLLNRANFGIPVRTIGDPGFGSSVNTVTPARVVQFAIKLGF